MPNLTNNQGSTNKIQGRYFSSNQLEKDLKIDSACCWKCCRELGIRKKQLAEYKIILRAICLYLSNF